MSYAVSVQSVTAQPIAAVRRRLHRHEIASGWKPALDLVWDFLRANPGLRTDGHNFFLYHHPQSASDPMDIDFGVQVTGAFAPEGEVSCVQTPAGEAATAKHVGPYSGMRAAHEAIHAWRAANNRRFAGQSWELYGDWNADESKLETDIFYLLA
jgi:effector-binding domain-containing protein